jgi:hypothetical protein
MLPICILAFTQPQAVFGFRGVSEQATAGATRISTRASSYNLSMHFLAMTGEGLLRYFPDTET